MKNSAIFKATLFLLMVSVGLPASAQPARAPTAPVGLMAETMGMQVMPASVEVLSGFASPEEIKATLTQTLVRKIQEQLKKGYCAPAEDLGSDTGHLGRLTPIGVVSRAIRFTADLKIPRTDFVAKVVSQPSHGTVNQVADTREGSNGHPIFIYTPQPGFLGDDKVRFEVSVHGYRFKVDFTVKVVSGDFNDACEGFGADQSVQEQRIQIALDSIELDKSSLSSPVNLLSEVIDGWFHSGLLNITVSFDNLLGQTLGRSVRKI